MPTVVGVKLRQTPKTLTFDAAGFEVEAGAAVIVKTERGEEFGEVVVAPHEAREGEVVAALKPVLREATEEDIRHAGELREREREAMPIYRKIVGEHGLDMKPVDVEYLFDGSKVVFYFVAEERVDFRELVRDLAARFKARIDMRQVGVRDEARMVGGIGHCGEQLCCVRFSGDFQPVSIRMAKEQDLPLNPLKISGLCGRLMCCLRYEYDTYKEFKTRAPKRGSMVETPMGPGKVSDLDTPRETVTLRLESGGTVSVPVSMMECRTGQGCPCSVSEQALEELRGLRESALTSALTGGADDSPAVSEEQPAKRKRRRRAKGADSEGDRQSGGQPAKAAASERRTAQDGRADTPVSGRRRRRRRRDGSDGDKST